MHPDRQKPDTALAADSENPLVPADADVEKLGLIEHVPNERGIWQLTEEGRRKLHKVKPRIALVAFSTDLRVALWSTCEHVFSQLDTPITL